MGHTVFATTAPLDQQHRRLAVSQAMSLRANDFSVKSRLNNIVGTIMKKRGNAMSSHYKAMVIKRNVLPKMRKISSSCSPALDPSLDPFAEPRGVVVKHY